MFPLGCSAKPFLAWSKHVSKLIPQSEQDIIQIPSTLFNTLSMIRIAEFFARITAYVDRLHSRHFHEVELIRIGTRHVHRRLHLINVSAGGFLTAPCSPNLPIENGATFQLTRSSISHEDLYNWQKELHAIGSYISICCLH